MSLKIASRMSERITVRTQGPSVDGMPTEGDAFQALAFVMYMPGREQDQDGVIGAPRTRAVVQAWHDDRFNIDCTIEGMDGRDWRVVGISSVGRLHEITRMDCEVIAGA